MVEKRKQHPQQLPQHENQLQMVEQTTQHLQQRSQYENQLPKSQQPMQHLQQLPQHGNQLQALQLEEPIEELGDQPLDHALKRQRLEAILLNEYDGHCDKFSHKQVEDFMSSLEDVINDSNSGDNENNNAEHPQPYEPEIYINIESLLSGDDYDEEQAKLKQQNETLPEYAL